MGEEKREDITSTPGFAIAQSIGQEDVNLAIISSGSDSSSYSYEYTGTALSTSDLRQAFKAMKAASVEVWGEDISDFKAEPRTKRITWSAKGRAKEHFDDAAAEHLSRGRG